jgi:hypothetical protein
VFKSSFFKAVAGVRGILSPLKRTHYTHRLTRYVLACSASCVLMSPAVNAEVLLTLKSSGQTLEITRQQLEALPTHELQTTTAWTDGVRQFKGPLVRDVLGLLEQPIADSATARLIALNEYEVKVAASDYLTWDVILAYEQDGKRLSRVDKGPLWVVYPRDQHDELQDSRVDHRWAWMLRTIVIEP